MKQCFDILDIRMKLTVSRNITTIFTSKYENPFVSIVIVIIVFFNNNCLSVMHKSLPQLYLNIQTINTS